MKKYGKAGNKEKYEWYKKRQLVQKILLNSLYGVLGLPAFRFYDVDNATAVTTLTGQTVIKSTADMANINTIRSWVIILWIVIYTLILIPFSFLLYLY